MKTLFMFIALFGAAMGCSSPNSISSDRLLTITARKRPGMLQMFTDFSTLRTYRFIDMTYQCPMDHFASGNTEQIDLVYQWNDEFYAEGGPIFININDGQASRWITGGLIYDLARELNGSLISTDYRFTGVNSLPEFRKEYLPYFTVDQLVADVGLLVNTVRQNFADKNVRVILFGSGFGGTLATLTRNKYPNLIDGVWSSDGIFTAAAPDRTFFRSLSKSIFQYGSPSCVAQISSVLEDVVNLVKQRNHARLRKLFNLCDSRGFINFLDAPNVIEQIYHFIVTYVDKGGATGIRQLCSDIGEATNPLAAFGRWTQYVYDSDGQCRDLTYTFLYNAHVQQTRVFAYFYCVQFGTNFFVTQSASEPISAFPDALSAKFYEDRCQDIFGNRYNRTVLQENVSRFNAQQGSQWRSVTNAIFTVSEVNPLRSRGVDENVQCASEVVVTNKYGAEADMTSLSDDDSAGLRATKEKVLNALRTFSRRQ